MCREHLPENLIGFNGNLFTFLSCSLEREEDLGNEDAIYGVHTTTFWVIISWGLTWNSISPTKVTILPPLPSFFVPLKIYSDFILYICLYMFQNANIFLEFEICHYQPRKSTLCWQWENASKAEK